MNRICIKIVVIIMFLNISRMNGIAEIEQNNPNKTESKIIKLTSSEDFDMLGISYYEKGEYDKAIESFNKALKLDMKNTRAYINRGNAYDDKGEYLKAIDDYSQAIKLDPKEEKTYFNRGIAYYKNGYYNKAIDDYTEAIKLNPAYANAYTNLGYAYKEKGMMGKAQINFLTANGLRFSNTKIFIYGRIIFIIIILFFILSFLYYYVKYRHKISKIFWMSLVFLLCFNIIAFLKDSNVLFSFIFIVKWLLGISGMIGLIVVIINERKKKKLNKIKKGTTTTKK